VTKRDLWQWLTAADACSRYTCEYCLQTCGLEPDSVCPKNSMEEIENSMGKSIYGCLADILSKKMSELDGDITEEDIADILVSSCSD